MMKSRTSILIAVVALTMATFLLFSSKPGKESQTSRPVEKTKTKIINTPTAHRNNGGQSKIHLLREGLGNGVIRQVPLPENCKISTDALREFHAKVSKIPFYAEDYDKQLEEAMTMLKDTPLHDVACLLANLANIENSREMVLDIIGILWEHQMVKKETLEEASEEIIVIEEENQDDTENSEEEQADNEPADETGAMGEEIIANILMGCLSDDNEDTRQHAVDVLGAMSQDVVDTLAPLLLSGDFSDVKKDFLEQHANSDDFKDLAFFFQALDDEDSAIANYAHENLNAVLKQTFSSSADAFEWWERNGSQL